jgi:hypothetical protein
MTAIFEEITRALDEIDGSMSNAVIFEEAVLNEVCKQVVDRNGEFHLIAVEPDPEKRWSKFKTIVASHVETDAGLRNNVDMIEVYATTAKGCVIALRQEFQKLKDAIVAQVGNAEDRARSLQSQVEALTARAREHALHNDAVREQVWAITDGCCYYCEVKLVRPGENTGGFADPSAAFHIDHLVPKASGGPDHLANYVPACQRCNIQKRDKSFAEFMAWRKQPKLTVVA